MPGTGVEERAEDLRVEMIEALRRDWQLEMNGIEMYQVLAQRERNPERRQVFEQLSKTEEEHAALWAKKLAALGASLPERTKSDGHAMRLPDNEGLASTILSIEDEEREDVLIYVQQLRRFKDEEFTAALRLVILDELSHSQILRRLRTESAPTSALDLLSRRRRRSTGSWIGDAIYGVNDGLGAIFGIVSGVAGATGDDSKRILVAGMAGMIASALSMGSGAYLAAKSERELYDAELHRERETFKTSREDALEEMAVFYQLKGIPAEDAKKIADYLAIDEEQFIKSYASEKLNLTEDALSDPVVSAVSGSLSTAVGAFIPIIPFFFMKGTAAIVAAAIISLLAHFAVGAAKSLVTVRSWWKSGLEMTIVGAIEGVVTYVIGLGLGGLG